MRLSGKIYVVVTMVILIISVIQETRSARILMAQPIGTRSHKNFFMAIAENLVQRNHTVTIVTGHHSSHQHPNIREVVVLDGNIFNSFSSLFNTSVERMTWELYSSFITSCNQALSVKTVQDLFKEEFDLVMMYIYMTECFLTFVHKLKIPFIYVCPNMVLGGYTDLAGTPFFPSLMPYPRDNLEYPLTFGGRMAGTLRYVLEAAFMEWFYLPGTCPFMSFLALKQAGLPVVGPSPDEPVSGLLPHHCLPQPLSPASPLFRCSECG
ncbi:hypothetical protein GWK47_045637 [Chionoecetes opilio]|uniref:Uncharacterized protein n=1 Tax=Chionoecetes opilio TaxID=41210 RepID=A0A8J4YI78_CHIOP|nr:hypothetical protein GWK47_045637 [Chionoecetes opilio]